MRKRSAQPRSISLEHFDVVGSLVALLIVDLALAQDPPDAGFRFAAGRRGRGPPNNYQESPTSTPASPHICTGETANFPRSRRLSGRGRPGQGVLAQGSNQQPGTSKDHAEPGSREEDRP